MTLPNTNNGKVAFHLHAHSGGSTPFTGAGAQAAYNAVAAQCAAITMNTSKVPIAYQAGMLSTNPALIMGPYEKGPHAVTFDVQNRINKATGGSTEGWFQHSGPLQGNANDAANRITGSAVSGGTYNIDPTTLLPVTGVNFMDCSYTGATVSVPGAGGGRPTISANSFPAWHWQDVTSDLTAGHYNMFFEDNCKQGGFSSNSFVQFTGATVATSGGVVTVTVPSGPFSAAQLSSYLGSNAGQIQFDLGSAGIFSTTITSVTDAQHAVIAQAPPGGYTGKGQAASIPWDNTGATNLPMTWAAYQHAISTALLDVMAANIPSYTSQANSGANADWWYYTGNLPSGSCDRGQGSVTGSTQPGAGTPGHTSDAFDLHCTMFLAEQMFRTVSTGAWTPTSYPKSCVIQNDCQMALDIQSAGTYFTAYTQLSTSWTATQIATMQQILVCLYYLWNIGKAFLTVTRDTSNAFSDPANIIYSYNLGAPTGPQTGTITDNRVGNATSIHTPGGTTKSYWQTFANGAVLACGSDETNGTVFTFDRPYVDAVTGMYYGTTYTATAPATTPVFLILQTTSSLPSATVLRASDGGIRVVTA